MRELVENNVKALVDSPDEVVVKETIGETIVIIEVSASQNDIGKVIGRDGRIANAIRTVVKAAAAKRDKKVTIEIMTSNKSNDSEIDK